MTENVKPTQEKGPNDPKDVQYYGALVNGWIQTRMEKDKSLLTLSGGAIALLVTLLTALKTITFPQLIVMVAAIISFIVALFCLIAIFHLNANHLENVSKNREKRNHVLHGLDTIAIIGFSLGIVLSLIAALLFGAQRAINTKGGKMNTEKNPQAREHFQESFNGVSNMKDDATDTDDNTSMSSSKNDTANPPDDNSDSTDSE